MAITDDVALHPASVFLISGFIGEDEKYGLLEFSQVDFQTTPIFFKATWGKLKMLLSVRDLIQY